MIIASFDLVNLKSHIQELKPSLIGPVWHYGSIYSGYLF